MRVGITGWGSVSALGHTRGDIRDNYLRDTTCLKIDPRFAAWTGSLPGSSEKALQALGKKGKYYDRLDRSVKLALLAAEQAVAEAGWSDLPDAGVQVGSSRGATGLWEKGHAHFLEAGIEGISPLTSPTTTLGNLASWVAEHLGMEGLAVEQSITCSTALHAMLNARAWLESGRLSRFLAGGTEAPLTAFTLEQMRALRLYAPGDTDQEPYPCQAARPAKRQNTMVLGEGAAMFCLEAEPDHAIAWLAGMGFSREAVKTPTHLSAEGSCLKHAMRKALEDAGGPSIDLIITHTPGTIYGDQAEFRALHHVFGGQIPPVTNNKWKIGHTLGASGALSVELALLALCENRFIKVPYLEPAAPETHDTIRHVMINAVGFGGNAVSLILSRD